MKSAQTKGIRMDSLDVEKISRKRIFLGIAKRANLICKEKNRVVKQEIKNEINKAIRQQQYLIQENKKNRSTGKDIEELKKCVDALTRNFTELGEKGEHLKNEQIIELRLLIRNAKEIIQMMHAQKRKKI
jgi:hypothetical protein